MPSFSRVSKVLRASMSVCQGGGAGRAESLVRRRTRTRLYAIRRAGAAALPPSA